jgi:hypothetical protein
VNAFAAVKSPPNREYTPNETTVTTTGILLRIKLFSCNKQEKVRKMMESKEIVM